jgi:hypothetical protein
MKLIIVQQTWRDLFFSVPVPNCPDAGKKLLRHQNFLRYTTASVRHRPSGIRVCMPGTTVHGLICPATVYICLECTLQLMESLDYINQAPPYKYDLSSTPLRFSLLISIGWLRFFLCVVAGTIEGVQAVVQSRRI